MNSNKLLRVGIPALGLCVFAFVQTGCRSEVLKERASVPPAQREMVQESDDLTRNIKADDDFKTFDDSKNTASAKQKNVDGKDFKYPKFEDTAHKPIYSAPASRKAAAGSASVYIVRRGDTLGKIAARHRIRTSDLAAANNLTLKSVIRVNQKLQIPGGKSVSAKKSSVSASAEKNTSAVRSGLYTVRRGDSVYTIAKRLKVKRADLMAANNLTPSSVLRPGQTLKLPGAKVVNEESVVEVKAPEQKSEEVKTAVQTQEKTKEDAGDDELLRNLEADAAKSSEAKKDDAAESVSAAAAKPAAAPAGGTPTEVYQEIHIDEYCKQHKINKAEMLKLNSNLNENSVLKPNTIFIIP